MESAEDAGEAFYRSIVELSPEPAWSADAEGRVTGFNPRWLDLTGLTHDAALQEGWVNRLPPEDRPPVAELWQQAIRTGDAFDLEHRIRMADGSYRWMRTRAHPSRDRRGRPRFWHGTTEDISRRKMLEARQTLLLDLADRFRGARAAREIVAAAEDAVKRELGADRVLYGDVDPGLVEVLAEAEDVGSTADPTSHGIPLKSLALGGGDALRAGSTVVVDEVAPDQDGASAPDHIPASRAGIVVPLIRDGRLRTLFHVGCSRARRWTSEEVGLVEDIAARTWDAVEWARATAVLRRNQARQAFLLVLGDRLRELNDPREITETVAEALGEHLHARRVAYGEVSHPDESVVFEAGWAAEGLHASPGPMPLPRVGPKEFDDLKRGLATTFEAAREPNRAATVAGHPAFVAVPLIRDGLLRAVLALGYREGHRWLADELALIGEVAARMWEALERARAEIALRELNATLEQRVAQRTAELTSSEARFRALFENAPASIVLIRVGPGERLTYEAINAEAERFMGKAAAAVVGRAVAEAANPGDPLPIRCGQCVATGRPVQYAMTIESGGQTRTAECVLAPLPATGRADDRLVIGISRDITAQRQAEDQLRQAQKMEAIGQLTGGIAHDFNNLLTGIIGALALMRKRVSQGRFDTLDRYADLAINSANRAAALTHRLLAFSRRQPLEAKPVDVNRLVASMDDLLRRTLGEGVVLESRVADGLWLTLCDPHQLENALLNLAINARDAMPDGGRLTIATANAAVDAAAAAREPGVSPGDYVVVSVADTGEGMTPDVMARVFDPFFTTKPIGQGTGLGLSMIYGFVKQSEGFTRIASEVGRGTTVELVLPRARGEGEDGPGIVTEAVGRAAAGETVLVVEDDEAVRGLVLDVLQDLGYRALEAADGPSGLLVLQSDARIDLLVTDVGLPGLNGRQLADQARVGRPDLKVLFVTGYAENAAFGNGHLDPGAQMMTKPFTVDMLATRIRAMIEAP